ncbi:cytochrome P450 [Streptomyces tsukubensis]
MASDRLQHIPRAPGALPLIGHTIRLGRDPLGFLRTLRKSGELVRIDLGTLPIYVATSARVIHQVTVEHSRSFEKGRLYDRVRTLFGNGLATANGDVHRTHRRLIQPMFHRSRIDGYAAVMSRRAVALADSWSDGQQVDIGHVMSEYTIETLAETMFSTDMGRPAVDAALRDLPVILRTMLLRAASPKALERLPIRIHRDFDRAGANLRRIIDDVVVATRQHRQEGGTDLVSLLLDARDEATGLGLTDEEVRDELVTFLFAGTDTTACVLGWAVSEIARHPRVEQDVLAEIDEVIGDRPVTVDDIPRLGTIRRVLDESVRLHGATLLMRRTTEPVELAGHPLPAGVEVAFSLYAMHRDPALYPDPDRFDPDRWLPERRAAVPREAFVPFGAGNRKCIGDAFAWTEATIALATLLARWRLRPVPGSAEPRESAAVMAYPDRVPMIVEARRP